jgi:hypothetical protein
MKKTARLIISLCLLTASPALLWAQGQSGSNPNAHSGRGRENVVIRGETVGFVSVSPALQKAIEAKNGKKPDPNPGAMGPNAEVRSDGFTYVSPTAKGKKK